MDIFTDGEPDLMGLELVREFDNLAKNLYSVFDDDLDEWAKSSDIYVGIGSEVVRQEVDIVLDSSSYPVVVEQSCKGKKNQKKGRNCASI